MVTHIQEVSVAELDDVVQFVNEQWNELSKRPKMRPEEREVAYWKTMQAHERILVYRLEDKTILGLLTLTKDNDVTRLDHFLVKQEVRRQGIGTKLLKMAERLARIWMTDHMILLGQEEQDFSLPYFQRLGFVLQCPIGQRGHISLEKKI